MPQQEIIELEIKVLGIDVNVVQNRLIDLGAINVLDTLTYITCFDINESINQNNLDDKYSNLINKVTNLTGSGLNLTDQNAHLRIRKQGDDYEFTLKYSTNTETIVKSDYEINVQLSEEEYLSLENQLTSSGFRVVARQEKKRISYYYKPLKLHFDIDKWPGIPVYLEIESGDVESIKKGITLLELDSFETSTSSGQAFFKKYGVNFYSNLTF